ncbi:3-oxoadipate enol-lactonase [Rhodocytophaga aerolata]|uniref:3-oxoadipate enol-lactonase n=1 Tax=Rhodocytophaga aerolata TaxID=455078 RepID=A0ABT8QYZ3_9BACT|nr:3-oxoadipate enol-lactonase [Rhodocytophaga aerolata]MDO1445066.1 3-oxoadipate enol-lactonase [Rhodocytophaga aerolata]
MQFIDINGHIIHYQWQNTGKEHTFVFINSLGTDYRIWTAVAEALQEYGNILLFDKRGHGLSDVVPDTNGLADFANDVQTLIEELKIKKCIIVGLSVGGMIAQVLASRIPEKIEKLVLCDTRHKIGNAPIWNDRIKAVEKEGLSRISDGVMQRWFSESFRKENKIQVTGYKNMLERTTTLGYIKTCEAIRDADLTELASQIKIPTLCIVGSEDKSTTVNEVRNLSELIKDSRFEIIQGSGHIPCVDNPQALVKLIYSFIDRPSK